MTLSLEPECGAALLACLDDDSLDTLFLPHRVAVQGRALALVDNELHTSVVALLKGHGDVDQHILQCGVRGGERSPEGAAEQRALEGLAGGIDDRMEGVALQEEAVKDLVTVLPIHVSTLVLSVLILDTEEKNILTVLVVHDLVLWRGQHFVGLAELMKAGQVHGHFLRVLHRVVSQCQFLEPLDNMVS